MARACLARRYALPGAFFLGGRRGRIVLARGFYPRQNEAFEVADLPPLVASSSRRPDQPATMAFFDGGSCTLFAGRGCHPGCGLYRGGSLAMASIPRSIFMQLRACLSVQGSEWSGTHALVDKELTMGPG